MKKMLHVKRGTAIGIALGVFAMIVGNAMAFYRKGFFDAIERQIGAGECKSIRKLARIKDFK